MTDLLSPVNWVSDDCKKYWNDAIALLDPSSEIYLRNFLSKFGSVLKSSTGFSIRIVVDTNVVLSEILRIMNGKRPFFSALTKSPFLDALAPIEMRNEIYEKIPEKFEGIEEQKALSIAERIFQGIRFVKGFKIHDQAKAEYLMGTRDPKDVVFVQIILEYNTHGVISKDKDFIDIDEFKTWELGEIGRILTEVNRGALTLWVAAEGIPYATLALIMIGMEIVSMGFEAVEQIMNTGLCIGEQIFTELVDSVKRQPLLTISAAGIVSLISLFLLSWEPSRQFINDIYKSGKRVVDSFVSKVTIAVNNLLGAIQVLVEFAEDQFPKIVIWFECLSNSIVLLFKRIHELEQIRT
ncbi:MAG: PIN domain-containing protein [Candidatus Thorarchaeota archaeon]|nr:PIN domain-containing protein [Candidatus Thorarchaeota archaeon]